MKRLMRRHASTSHQRVSFLEDGLGFTIDVIRREAPYGVVECVRVVGFVAASIPSAESEAEGFPVLLLGDGHPLFASPCKDGIDRWHD